MDIRNPGHKDRERIGRTVDGYRRMVTGNWKISVMLRN
jgi:hypothetical protein